MISAGLVVVPATASASHPGAQFAAARDAGIEGKVGAKKPAFNEKRVPPRIEKALGGDVELTPSGDYRVDVPRGPDLFTHGPDPIPIDARDGSASGAEGVPGTIDPYGTGGLTDPPLCVGDPNGDYYQHVLYGRPAGTTNRLEQFRSSFVQALFQMNYVLDRDSEASGGPSADYKFLCNQDLSLRIDSFVNQGAGTFSAVTSAARAAGFNRQNVDYTIFYDGDPTEPQCGVGDHTFDEDLDANNANNLGNDHAITWVDCWFNDTPMHENGHNQGATQYNAPHSTGTGAHCSDHFDVMCYNDGGDLDPGPPLASNDCAAGTLRFDCGFNTYFDSAPEGGEYLANNWNIGSPLNRFIVFGFGGGGNQPPTAAFTYDCPDLTCQFTDQSSDADGSIATRKWNFGDGSLTSSAQNPTHDYSNTGSGTYNVSLLVEDDGGDSDFVEVPVTISDGTPTRLSNGIPEFRTAGVQGTFDRYTFNVPPKRKRLIITTSGEECVETGEDLCEPDLDLYVARHFEPDEDNYNCRPFLEEISERCTFRNPPKGDWNIGVHNFAAEPGTDYEIKARYRGHRG